MAIWQRLRSSLVMFQRACSVCHRHGHHESACPQTSDLRRRTAEADAARLDFLEKMAHRKGGVLLHDGRENTGRIGIALKPGRSPMRTLRHAIDEVMRNNAVVESRRADAAASRRAKADPRDCDVPESALKQ